MKERSIGDAIRKFGLVCSGANMKILDRPDCAGEQSKYAMIGMFVFLTAAFATLSSGYALYKGFKSAWLAAAVGLLWGLFIFNVDRFIISTIRKKEIDPELPVLTRLGLWLLEFIKLSPRLVLAVLISIVISTPLEMKYFEPEIGIRIDDALKEKHDRAHATPLRDQSDDVKVREDENERLRGQINEKVPRRELLRDQLAAEAQGRRGTGRYGEGPVTRLLRQQLANFEKDLDDFTRTANERIRVNQEAIDLARAKQDKEDAEDQAKEQRAKDGFLNSLQALSYLEEKSPAVWLAAKFITLLVLVLECTPILMKMMTGYGPYDSVLATEEYVARIDQRTIVSERNRKANHDEAFNTTKDSLILTAKDHLARDAVLNLINLAQAEIDRATANAAQKVVNDFETEFTSSNYSRN